jgi:putative addiction module killer protein
MMELREYLDGRGRSPFSRWYKELDDFAATRIRVTLSRIAQGNLSGVKSVGSGVLEYRINFGPGYRVYFGRDGSNIVILLVGGTKKRQQDDIRAAISYWQDYKAKRAEELR